jgi:methyl-accepting chemotaxis protein
MKLTVGKKLGLPFTALLALMLLSSGITYLKSRQIRNVEQEMTNVRVPTVNLIYELQRDTNRAQSKGREAIFLGSQSAADKAMQQFRSIWTGTEKDVSDLDAVAPLWSSQEHRDRWAKVKDTLPKLRSVQEATISMAASGSADAIVKAGAEYRSRATTVKDPFDADLGTLADQFKAQLDENNQSLASTNASMTWTMLACILLALAMGIGVAVFMSLRMSEATSEILQKAESIAGGDLTSEKVVVRSNDELGDLALAMNKMEANLRAMIISVSENAQHVATASEEFSATSQQISANSEETTAQANNVTSATDHVSHNLTTVATGAEEMTATIKEIAKNASEAARIAGVAVTTAHETNATVAKLGESSAEIGQVIKVITSIAQQTNLLALNATIEAARAGEAGKGFAVVANEVKELAKQTAKATEDISRKINAIQQDTKGAVDAIATITGVITQINDFTSTIASAVEEQSATTNEMSRNVSEASKGSGQISENVRGMAQAAQSTSSSAHDSQKAAEQLAIMSTELRGLVEQFKTNQGEQGNGHARRANA